MKCSGCGKEINADTKFCKYCGTSIQKSIEINSIFENTRNPNSSKSKSGKVIKIIFLVTVAIAIALIIAVVLYFVHTKNMDIRKEAVDKKTQTEFGDKGVEEDDDSEEIEEPSETEMADVIDVEESVARIREQYNDIVSAMSSDIYRKIYIDNGITAYCEDMNLKAIVVAKDFDGNEYSRFYYYDEGELFFAYYEGDDAHRFYFQKGQLIRWRYFASASGSQNANNYDMENTSEYLSWENSVIDEAHNLKETWELVLEEGKENQEYILAGSESRYILESELDCLTKEELQLARNELYARHGRKFKDEKLTNYFSQFDWYNPTIEPEDFEESMLNDYEIANRDLIVQYEKEHGYR